MTIKLLLFVACVGIAVVATRASDIVLPDVPIDDDQIDFFRNKWASFQDTHNPDYATPEEQARRFGIFVDNFRYVQQHNIDYRLGKRTFEIAMNHFGDLTLEEHVQLVNGFNQTLQMQSSRAKVVKPRKRRRVRRAATRATIPGLVDWSKKGAVGPVLNQGRCGSCWSFATAAAFEGQYFLKHGQLPALSQQQLMDCSRNNGNNACHGGTSRFAMDYVYSVGGMASSAAYPYVGQQQQCSLRRADVLAMRGGAHPLTYGKRS